MTTNQQLELGFNGTQTRFFGRHHESRAARGKWWFARMREAVASAMDWPAETVARPEQIVFSEVTRRG
jgi:hypothetical protein